MIAGLSGAWKGNTSSFGGGLIRQDAHYTTVGNLPNGSFYGEKSRKTDFPLCDAELLDVHHYPERLLSLWEIQPFRAGEGQVLGTLPGPDRPTVPQAGG